MKNYRVAITGYYFTLDGISTSRLWQSRGSTALSGGKFRRRTEQVSAYRCGGGGGSLGIYLGTPGYRNNFRHGEGIGFKQVPFPQEPV